MEVGFCRAVRVPLIKSYLCLLPGCRLGLPHKVSECSAQNINPDLRIFEWPSVLDTGPLWRKAPKLQKRAQYRNITRNFFFQDGRRNTMKTLQTGGEASIRPSFVFIHVSVFGHGIYFSIKGL